MTSKSDYYHREYALQSNPAIGLYTEALQYAMEHRQVLGDSLYTRIAIQIYPTLSGCYFRTGQYNRHLETLKAFQKLALESENPIAMATAAIAVGASALKFNNYSRAKEVLPEGYEYIKTTNYTTLKFNSHITLFDIYRKKDSTPTSTISKAALSN
jgi:hypothetical protein